MDFNGMFSEIEIESLQTLLTSLRSDVSPLDTQIPGLDTHLSYVHQSHSPLRVSNAGDVIEIQGPPNSGKTHLLYLLLITCIMPSSYSSTRLNGWGKAAILFDTDGSFDTHRFKQLLSSRLSDVLISDGNVPAPGSLDALVHHSLQNLHIFQPTSSAQLAATILHLPLYHQAHLSGSEIGIVAVDSISAFYWLDRFTAEQLRSSAKYSKSDVINPLQHVLTALHNFRLTHLPVIVLTNWGLTPANTNDSSSNGAGMLYRQHLNPYPSPLVPPSGSGEVSSSKVKPLLHHITLSSSLSSQYPADFSFADMLATDHSRNTLDTTNNEIYGHVRTAGYPGTGNFSFRIERDGVNVN